MFGLYACPCTVTCAVSETVRKGPQMLWKDRKMVVNCRVGASDLHHPVLVQSLTPTPCCS